MGADDEDVISGPASDRLIQTGAAAKLLGVDGHTVAKYIDRGWLPGHRLPSGERRVSEAAVLAFLRAPQRVTGGAS